MTAPYVTRQAKQTRGVLDRIKFDGAPHVLAWKYPHDDVRCGSQVIVNESQAAIVVIEGEYAALLGAGRHTLTTGNVPLLSKLAAGAFGGSSPFTAEVWFLNLAACMDVKFGTSTPMQLHDPKYGVIVPVTGHGQMILKISDCPRFLRHIVGTSRVLTTDDISIGLRGVVTSQLKSVIAEHVATQGGSIVDITRALGPISQTCRESVAKHFARCGLRLVQFMVSDVSVPEDDPVVRRLRSVLMDRAEFEVLGDHRYQQRRPVHTPELAGECRSARHSSSRCAQCGGPLASIRFDCAYCGAIMTRCKEQDAESFQAIPKRSDRYATPSTATSFMDAAMKTLDPVGTLRREALNLPDSPEDLVSHFAKHVGGVPQLHYGNIHYQACEAAITKLKAHASRDPRLTALIEDLKQQLEAKPRERQALLLMILGLLALFVFMMGIIAFAGLLSGR